MCVGAFLIAEAGLERPYGNYALEVRPGEINRLENEANHLVRGLVTDLFENEKDCIALIKIKEIYEFLDATMDYCEDVADVLQTVVVKNV